MGVVAVATVIISAVTFFLIYKKKRSQEETIELKPDSNLSTGNISYDDGRYYKRGEGSDDQGGSFYY